MLSLIVDSRLRLPLGQLSPELLDRIKKETTFRNPQYYINLKQNYSNFRTLEYIKGYRQSKKELSLPRGITSRIIEMVEEEGIEYQVINKTRMLPKVDFEFHGELRDYQTLAVDDILKRKFGFLTASTGSGKTIIALAVIAERKQNVIIVVHTKELFLQWQDRIETFLNISKKTIGLIGDGKKRIGESGITIGLVQSLYKCSKEVSKHFGFLIVDEGHRAPARMFKEVVGNFDSAFMLGLSATPYRKDQLTKLIHWYLGDCVHEIDRTSLEDSGAILKAEVTIRKTKFRTNYDQEVGYSTIISDLTKDFERNELIIKDVMEARERGETCLVLTDRKEHANYLQDQIQMDSVVLTGDSENRPKIVQKIHSGEIKIIVATGQLIGEGFDCKGLETLFLTAPIKFKGRLHQYIGRVLRPAPGKDKAKIVDYWDEFVEILDSSYMSRKREYRKLGWLK